MTRVFVGGYLLTWGDSSSLDLQGDYFTPNSYVGLKSQGSLQGASEIPILWHHALKTGGVGKTEIGILNSFVQDRIGLRVRGELDTSQKCFKGIMQLFDDGIVYWSPGSLAIQVVRASDGYLSSYPVQEGSLTVSPAQPQSFAVLEAA